MSAGYGRVGGCALYCGFLEVEYINTRYTKKKKKMEMMPKVKQSFSEPSDPHNVPHSNLISQPYSFEPYVSSWFDN